jgi:hypothetical protein
MARLMNAWRGAVCRSIGLVSLTFAVGLRAQPEQSEPLPADPSEEPATAPPATAPPATGAPTQPPPASQPPPGYAYPPPPGYYPVPYYVPPLEPPAWKPGEPAPPGYLVESRVDVKTIRAGAGMLVAFWVISVIAGAALNKAEEPKAVDGDDVEPGDWSVLYWPIAGPFLAMRNTSTDQAGWGLLLLDGVFQSVGALGIVIGLVRRDETLLRNAARVEPSLRVVPTLNQTGAGVGLLGRF